jgi:hypothetical protein
VKTRNTKESLARVAAISEPELPLAPDVVINIPSIGIYYRQVGTSNMTRAIKVLKNAATRLCGPDKGSDTDGLGEED